MDEQTLAITERSKVRRAHERGFYERSKINAILDAASLCHVGYVLDGKPAVTPTLYWREGNHVYWHGSSASRAIRKSEGLDVCLAVTLMDGLVLARSAFHHSANYRSVMIYGRAIKIDDPELKVQKLRNFVDNILPGRWDGLRPMNEQEIKATTVLSLPIEEASAKIRDGGPNDDDEDYALPIWAGVIPLSTVTGPVQDDPRNLPDVARPDHVSAYKLK